MSAKLIDGKAFADGLIKRVGVAVSKLNNRYNFKPGLAVVLVGENPASEVYVKNKILQTEKSGMVSIEHRLPETTSEKELLALVKSLNEDDKIDGILVQLPLPKHINENAVINSISPSKDVDGFSIPNVGLLSTSGEGLIPCTPLGCLLLLQDHLGDLTGKNAVIIGRSNIVGKPMAQLLIKANCTVTITHSKTKNLEGECKKADILVAAIGSPLFVKKEWVKNGAVVLDVGINRLPPEGDKKGRLVGDVDFENVIEIASAITPVPGGVGPMTIACLLRNTVTASCKRRNINEPEM
ncbi:MAG: bifunctional methylenetetrahydrofolate dehydrogenase/methenyltetrahydrofolate cyclohydrolase FolD [SAR116 cluster bacterium]|nr:bifunctional methylenetetrahydrofolate dehydrogenase/methenyltetrahydrofolate cyclohydrolase FolD [SAR116 cluster bacterium]